MQDWRSLEIELRSALDEWEAADEIIRRRKAGLTAVCADTGVEKDMALSRIKRLLEDRDRVAIPAEFRKGGLLLLLLLVIGTLLPLWHLGAPDNSKQSWFLVPWALVVAMFGRLMYSQAHSVRDHVKSVEPSSRVKAELELRSKVEGLAVDALKDAKKEGEET
jgi:hypothetical protein